MSLTSYFQSLIDQVEKSDISNQGTDDNGFYKPTRSILLQKLNMLKDLHGSPAAKAMVQNAWGYVSENLPPEWLILTADQKAELRKILE